jgi:hypothetical protein
MGILNQREATAGDDREVPGGTRRQPPPADSCHVWAADGDLVKMVQRGETLRPMLTVRDRLVDLGRDPEAR